ncbi:uncharacterized protein EV420DRAFT_1048004 [Desarmillaria tabescens]|uniref:XPG-I domain-containing protein n=1 Tax=Armillaria tabescens TaxID=1929756 RepID=A0AA39NF69_ARMTA|nr:uncharacterized protein EV420DRAFT_1048004 [Desarmillaria tabescens]KAK0464511.1 hypothetical protein EV420DRAFT_1048004 [Desarmillaria tabescens]
MTLTTDNDWSLLAEISRQQSLTTLSLAKYDSPSKGFRLGIDVQPWFHHTNSSKMGENPRLRLLFFRCKHLLGYPILPLFMFDQNPQRHTSNHPLTEELTEGFIHIIKAFGFQWRYAPGDPLAELAYLNREGFIDAVLTDDVAVWVFGALTVWRNPSSSHPNAKHPEKQTTYKIYDGVTQKHRSAMLIVLLCTRSQPRWCNTSTSLRLAKSKCAVELYEAVTTRPHDSEELQNFLTRWRGQLCGYLQVHKSLLSHYVPDNFPELPHLASYIYPDVSPSLEIYSHNMWTSKRFEPSLPKLARICEILFEWGWKDRILARFHSNIWGPVAVRILRRQHLCPSLLDAEVFRPFGGDGGEAGKVIDKIVNSRRHHSTGETPEYRVMVDTQMLILWTEAGLKGTRKPLEVDTIDLKGKGKEVVFDENSDEGSDDEEENGDKEGPDDERQGTEPTRDVDADEELDSSDTEGDTPVASQSQQKQLTSTKANGKKKREKKPVDPRKPLHIWIPAKVVEGVKVKLIKDYTKACEEKQKAREKKNSKRQREKDDKDPRSPKKTKRSTTIPTSRRERVVPVKKITEAQAKAEGLSSLFAFGFTKESRVADHSADGLRSSVTSSTPLQEERTATTSSTGNAL